MFVACLFFYIINTLLTLLTHYSQCRHLFCSHTEVQTKVVCSTSKPTRKGRGYILPTTYRHSGGRSNYRRDIVLHRLSYKMASVNGKYGIYELNITFK